MPHLVETREGEEAVLRYIRTMFGAAKKGVNELEEAKPNKVELWGSNFSEPGGDYCIHKFFKDGQEIATLRQAGY